MTVNDVVKRLRAIMIDVYQLNDPHDRGIDVEVIYQLVSDINASYLDGLERNVDSN